MFLGQPGKTGPEQSAEGDILSFVQNIWLPGIRQSKHSWKVDERISRQHILPFFGSCQLNDITQEKVMEWLAGFDSRNFAVSTKNRILCVLKDIFKTALKNGYLAVSPAQSIPSGADKRKPAENITKERLQMLMERLLTSDRPEAAALALMALTGANKNEILTARWENFYPDKRLLVTSSLSGQKRNLWLTSGAMRIIERLPRKKDCPWLFPGKNPAKPIAHIFSFWSQLRHECGLDILRIQNLRYACCGTALAEDIFGHGAAESITKLPADVAEKIAFPLRQNLPGSTTHLKPIAIIGIGMRFPGNVNNLASMWQTLMNGECNISVIPEDRWPVHSLSHPVRSEPGRSVSFAAAIVNDIDKFDASFFKISPREASWMDPQQRLLLEIAHEAMEDASIPPKTLAGSRCGVYVGISGMDYGQHALNDLASMTGHSMTGNTLSIAANRLSYFYDLHGPSLAMDTACSSALTAIHHACQALRNGEAPIALAGGINLLMHPYSFIGFSHASMLSAKGACRPFDAEADGYVRGEGGALLLLKPLEDAERDGDHIHAVILGTGVNSDGSRKSGMTIPSVDAQTELMTQVLAASGLQREEIDFVEAHGTGTPVGDPVEAQSIGRTYGSKRRLPVPISSGKANFGHLEPASGMVGIIKAILTLKHAHMPPMPFKFNPNPQIDFEGLGVECVPAGKALVKDGALIGAVNSFGFGGVNAHALLTTYTHKKEAPTRPGNYPPLFLSANTEAALREMALAHARSLEELDSDYYYDYAWSAAFLKDRLPKRLLVTDSAKQEIINSLRNYAEGREAKNIILENAPAEEGTIAFVYSGNGAQWHGMGRQLYEESPAFARILDSLDKSMLPVVGFSVIEKLLEGDPSDLEDTAISQPLLFGLQIAITILLNEMGIKPHFVAGHSVGEVAAAWASGALDLEQAIQVIHARSYSQSKTFGMGTMAAVALSAAETIKIIIDLGLEDKLEVAAINSPANSTISGDTEAIERMRSYARSKNVFFKRLDLEYAFHSRHMEMARQPLEEILADLSPRPTSEAILISTVTGSQVEGKALDSKYWWRNMRDSVNFASAIAALGELGARVFVEIGPHAVLQRYMRENLGTSGVNAKVLPSLQKTSCSIDRLKNVAASIHLLGVKEGLARLFPYPGKKQKLPFYPWQRERRWYPSTSERVLPMRRQFPLLGWTIGGVDPVWENILDPRKDKWLCDHVVNEAIIFPGAAYIEIAFEAANAWTGSDTFGLENFEIILPLVFEPNSAHTMRCAINPRDGYLRILSRPRLDSGQWIEHAHCRVIAISPAVQLAGNAAQAHSETMSGEKLYAITQSLGLNYGPFFRIIKEINFSAETVEASLNLPESADYILTPAALDACFHSIAALYSAREPKNAYLPIGAARISYFGANIPSRIRAILKKSIAKTLHIDFQLFDAQDNVVAELVDCRFRRLPVASNMENLPASWHMLPWLEPAGLESSDWMPDIPSLDSLPLDELLSSGTSRKLWFTEILPSLEAVVLAALGEFFKQGFLNDGDPDPYIRWMKNLLLDQGVLSGNQEVLIELPDWRQVWLETYRLAPQFLPALLPLARTLHNLPDVLGKRQSSLALKKEVSKGIIAGEKNWQNPAYMGTEQIEIALIRFLAAKLPRDRRISVLELGESSILENMIQHLDKDKFYHLLVTESGPMPRSLEQMKRLGLDSDHILRPPLDWLADNSSKPERQFDVILIHQSLHESVNISADIQKIGNMLKAGGMFILSEQYADWSADIIDGLDPAWWRFDEFRQPVSSRMPPEAWQDAFASNGFADLEIIREKESEELKEGAYLLVGKKAVEACKSSSLPASLPDGKWLLLGDAVSESTLEIVAESLRKLSREVEIRTTAWGNSFNAANIVIFPAPHVEVTDISRELNRINDCLRNCRSSTHNSLWLVTRGAFTNEAPAQSMAQSAIVGLARVFASENQSSHIHLIDVQSSWQPDQTASTLITEFANPAPGFEVILSSNGRHTLRLLPVEKLTEKSAQRCKLTIPQPGRLDNLQWSEFEDEALMPDEVEARVMAVGLNFRDVMLTLGLLPEDSLENGFAGPTLGLEFAGYVTKVGKDVTNFSAGDRVAGFAASCFASHVRAPAHAIEHLPSGLDYTAAAASPTIFITAWYALKHLANLRKGEIVLIHGAAGGVGSVAIQIAHLFGARVFATAGSKEKRDFLRTMGVELVLDSRNLNFADEIMAITDGQGVDVVLNSLAGEGMRRSMTLLKPFGRFLELGKRDYVENTPIGLKPFKENISYFSIDVDQLLIAKPQLAAEMFVDVMARLRNGDFVVPPYRVFEAHHIKDAFRTMQKAAHIGKIVVDMKNLPPVVNPGKKIPEIDFSGTWLVTGGLSGFGLATARHLLRNGVKNIVLASRRGKNTPGIEDIMAELNSADVSFLIKSCDFANLENVKNLISVIKESMPPLKGVVHAAAVFDDRFLNDMDAESFENVVNPKLLGAWNLHHCLHDADLRYFVVYSSISVALGNPGQGNYVAANAGLEALINSRMAQGLPGAAIAWGPVGDVGYLSRHGNVGKALALRLGRDSMSAAQALEKFNEAISKNGVHIIADVDWNIATNFMENLPERFSLLTNEASGNNIDENGTKLKDLLHDVSPEKAQDMLCSCIIDEAAKVMGMDAAQFPADRPLQSLGLDSLMAMELALGIEHRTGFHISPLLLQDSPTVQELARRLMGRLGNEAEDVNEKDALLADLARQHSENIAPEMAKDVLASLNKSEKFTH